jgi:soluble lytic murein transglycosylase-like protein
MDTFDGDLELTLAAYNAGEGAVLQAGRKIPKFAETEKYVPRVLALYNRSRLRT